MKNANRRIQIIIMTTLTVSVILLVQFGDSFCTGLYEKLQSFLLQEFLIVPKGYDTDTAAAYLNLFMLPCYAITATALAVRALIDKYGKNQILFLNLIILLTGCIICMLSPTLLSFLIGNAIVTFSCTIDIQYIYIVDELPYKYHGTIRGITSAISAFSAMLIPLFRSSLIDQRNYSWRNIYLIAFILIVGILCLTTFLLKLPCFKKRNSTSEQSQRMTDEPLAVTKKNADNANNQSLRFKQLFQFIFQDSNIRNLLIPLLVLGIATPGITFYNEPLITFAFVEKSNINIVLSLQPIVTLIFTTINGFLADHFKRRTIIAIDIIFAFLSLLIFIINLKLTPLPVLLGVTWGLMVSAYFSAVDLIQLIIMENTPQQNIGKLSAISTFTYGFGDAIGMLAIGVLTLYFNMENSKLLLTIPFLIATLIFLLLITMHNKMKELK